MHRGTKASSFDYDTVRDGETPVFLLEAAWLTEVTNPLAEPPWAGMNSPVTIEEVFQAIHDGRMESEPVGPAEQLGMDEPSNARNLHVARIAWLVSNPQDDPISIEVSIPGVPGGELLTDFVVSDGNHRLAAALIRNEPIRASFSGSWNRFAELFPDATFDGIIESEQESHPVPC